MSHSDNPHKSVQTCQIYIFPLYSTKAPLSSSRPQCLTDTTNKTQSAVSHHKQTVYQPIPSDQWERRLTPPAIHDQTHERPETTGLSQAAVVEKNANYPRTSQSFIIKTPRFITNSSVPCNLHIHPTAPMSRQNKPLQIKTQYCHLIITSQQTSQTF